MNLGGVIHLNKTGICIVFALIFILFLYIFTQNDSSNSTNDKLTGINLKELLKLSIKAAESGGLLIVSTKDAKIETKGKTKEGADESVTSADYKSHCAMIGILKHRYPSLNIVSEEAKTDCNKYTIEEMITGNDQKVENLSDSFENFTDITVWVDPLDATQEYTENLVQYVTTMVCVAVKGEPIIGVIHKPYTKETFWGWVGKTPLSNIIPRLIQKDSKIMLISRSHSGDIENVLKNKFLDYTVKPAGGSGYKVLEVINNEADAYVHKTFIKKWDICAGNAILNSLGGKFTTLTGKNISYDSKLSAVNEDGLVAALKNHDYFLKTMSSE